MIYARKRKEAELLPWFAARLVGFISLLLRGGHSIKQLDSFFCPTVNLMTVI